MSSTDRQNNLLISEDWKKIYQSFKNVDFQSYDFENLRRTMIDYIRINFPENFNDYIESSEYLALIDLIAYVGQSIAFRVDLNARENFLELAERRDSVLRLARMINYNASRNIAASGLLKVTTVTTSESVLDSNGRNLAGQQVTWNDPSNATWYDQFIKIINAALPSIQQFGNPNDSAKIYGIPTAQYRFNSTNISLPVFSFTKTVAGQSMNFEITSTTFKDKTFIYEETPRLGNAPACIFRDDGYGAGSPSTGFFFNFTQGTLNQDSFTITQPSSNQLVNIDTRNINNTDVWLYGLDQNSRESTLWTQVPATIGNNIIYNSLSNKIKNIYSVITRASDQISLQFADGTFGNLPMGTFKVYYRSSNGLAFSISPVDIRNVAITIPYNSIQSKNELLTINLNLQSTVSNATAAETNLSVKTNAPQTYYTQNRMITGEDYNISPLATTSQVVKIKSINRSSSGISRYFDLKDPTGKYSSTNLFADDGILYQEIYTSSVNFSYLTQSDIEGIIYNEIYTILNTPNIRNFYYANYINYLQSSLAIAWYNITTDSNSSSGYIGGVVGSPSTAPYKVGAFTDTDLKYLTPGALIKFIVPSPSTQYFDTNDRNIIKTGDINVAGARSYLWAKVISVADDGTASNNTGTLSTGFGAIVLNQQFDTTNGINPLVEQIIPKFTRTIDTSTISTMTDLIFENQPFGLRYDVGSQRWKIVFETNINTTSIFSTGNQGDITNGQKDASWLLLFTTNNQYYTVTARQIRYIFESDKQLNFYFDSNLKVYDVVSNTTIKDSLKILNINTRPDLTQSFTTDLPWDIISAYRGLDGYVDNKKLVVSFADFDNDGIVDNPQLFLDIVGITTGDYRNKYIVEKRYLISSGQEDYKYVYNDPIKKGPVLILNTEASVGGLTQYVDGQYFYFVDTNVVKQLELTTNSLNPTLDYKIYIGRDNLRFQYIHNADYDSRIDPGASNIIDIYVLTDTYNIQYRQWLAGANVSKPLPPSSSELNSLLSTNLNLIKSISDEIIYHPVSYRLLFGSFADLNLQANFNVIKNLESTASNSDVIARILSAINQFFILDNWNFGDKFYFTELATYVTTQLAPDITSFVIVPKQDGQFFGSLFEISCAEDEIFLSCATAADITVVSGFTSINLKTVTGNAITVVTNQNITSATNGVNNG